MRAGQVRIGALVAGALDITSASPRRYLFEVLSHFARTELEVERLQYFATPEGRDDLYNYNQRERRTFLEVLQVNYLIGHAFEGASFLASETQLNMSSAWLPMHPKSLLLWAGSSDMCAGLMSPGRTSRARRCPWSGCCRRRRA